jgi:acetyl esterase/lipase
MTVLEPLVAELDRVTAAAPSLRELGVREGRRTLEELQSGPTPRPDVVNTWSDVPCGDRRIRVRISRPAGAPDRVLPVVLYLHGGGWVLGSANTHDRLVCELVVGADAAVVFVEYDRSPAAHYPVALDQCYAVAHWICDHRSDLRLDASRMAVAGDSAGGNLAAALAITANRRGDVSFIHQSLYYPVTDAAQDTDSYREFAGGPHLTADSMAWFWDAYLPDHRRRQEATASPLRAELEELAGLPDTFIIVNEYDVLRDEGEAYARRLTTAGVRCCCVRYDGAVHDFMMLDTVRDTAVASRAVAQAAQELHRALHP